MHEGSLPELNYAAARKNAPHVRSSVQMTSTGFPASIFSLSSPTLPPPSTGTSAAYPYSTHCTSSLSAKEKIKVKRTRQRVDAGEPRNTYSSIPNYTSGRSSLTGSMSVSPPAATPLSRPLFGTSVRSPQPLPEIMSRSLPPSAILDGNLPTQGYLQDSVYGPSFNPAAALYFSNMHYMLRMQASLGRTAGANAVATEAGPVLRDMLEGVSKEEANGSSPSQNDSEHESCGPSPVSPGTLMEKATEGTCASRIDRTGNGCVTSTVKEELGVDAAETPVSGQHTATASPQTKSNKRKQYQPQQLGTLRAEEITQRTHGAPDDYEDSNEIPCKRSAGQTALDRDSLSPTTDIVDPELKAMQSQIISMQHRYMELLQQKQKGLVEEKMSQPKESNVQRNVPPVKPQPAQQQPPPQNPQDFRSLGHVLKSELTTNVNCTVDKVLAQYMQMLETARSALLAAQQAAAAVEHQATPTSAEQWANAQRQVYINQLTYYNALTSYASAATGLNHLATAAGTTAPPPSIFPAPTHPYFGSGGGFGASPPATGNVGLTGSKQEALSLVMPKKKRSKVTDTKLTKPYAKLGDEGRGATSPSAASFQQYAPTMVPGGRFLTSAGTGYASSLSGIDDRDGDSPLSMSDEAVSELGQYERGMMQTPTLTPMHLRKAKLMFFYTRYPSSTLLKAYFPDIRFDKNNTAQLVKWFSNFREFYYIQMEKYARQAIAEGVRNVEEITVSLDSELYRVLNLHYNRNNHIQFQVPTHFRDVLEATLREFFKSLQAGRDQEPSWKKAIYKVIARLDQQIPEYFKTPNFLEQLE